jgi:hypothetical protein
VLGEIALDASLLHHRVGARHGSAPPIRRKLLQNSSDNTKPRAPAIIKMIPTVLMLNPEVVTSTAKVKMAPTTNRKRLTPRLNLFASSRMRCQCSCPMLHVRVPRKTTQLSLLLRFSAATATSMSRRG